MILLFVLTTQSYSIPAFARKYDMSCNVCHSPSPKLKPYGDEFARNGFQLADKESHRYLRETGDDKLTLLREFPVGARLELYGQYQSNIDQKNDFRTPLSLKFLSGGQIARDVAYYFYFFFSEKGEVAGIEDAFVMFNNIGGVDFDFYVGQYQVTDPLFKRELRITLEDYKIYSTQVAKAQNSLLYDRGIMLTYATPTNTDLAFQVMNGNGIGSPIGDGFDKDSYKNFLFRVSQDVAEPLRVGAFGFLGKEKGDANRINDTWILGPDLTVAIEPVELNVQYVHREDKNPNFLDIASTIKTRGGFAEFIYSPEGDKSVWYATLLYNNVISDIEALKYESITANWTYLLARNFRLGTEFTHALKPKHSKFSVGFFAGF